MNSTTKFIQINATKNEFNFKSIEINSTKNQFKIIQQITFKSIQQQNEFKFISIQLNLNQFK